MTPIAPRLRWGVFPDDDRRLRELARRIERLTGAAPVALPGTGEASDLAFVVVADATAASRLVAPGVPRLWTESVATDRGEVGRLLDDRPVDRFPFECIATPRFWNRGALLADAASRALLACAVREPNAPWNRMDPGSTGGSGIPLPVRLREWGLALVSGDAWFSIHREPGRTLADPFPIVHEGKVRVFFEEQARGRAGVLSVGVLERERLTEIVSDILPSATHRSWPNVFHHQGALWMLPESARDGEVALWRCTVFPDRWEKVRVLLSGRGWADPVLHRHAGRWWLFVSPTGPIADSHSDSLELFHAEDLLADAFEPHPWNPVAIGLCGSRPAGRIFVRDGSWIRPAQNASGHYGRGLVFHEIEELTPTRYRERVVSRMVGPPGTEGIHTWNPTPDGRVLSDLLWSRPRIGEGPVLPHRGNWPVSP